MSTENAAIEADLDTATRAFAEALVESPEFSEYARTAELFEKDEEAQNLFNSFQTAQQRISAQQEWGASDSADEVRRVRELEQQVQENAVITEHFNAQTELLSTLKELNKLIGDELGFDYAALARPPMNCCSTGCG